MTISLISPPPRLKILGQKLNKRDSGVAELLLMLNATANALDAIFEIDELAALSGTVAELRTVLLATPEASAEGVVVRERCQRLLETFVCGMIETSKEAQN